jgi:hypothetical protein
MSKSTPSELPSWLDDNDDEQTLTFNQATKKVEPATIPGATNSSSSGDTLSLSPSDTERKKQWVFWGFKISTIGLCVLMYITALISMGQADSITYSGKIMTAIYMIMFTTVLLVFEIAELKQVIAVEHFYRRNFGFLFNAQGKSLFIIL